MTIFVVRLLSSFPENSSATSYTPPFQPDPFPPLVWPWPDQRSVRNRQRGSRKTKHQSRLQTKDPFVQYTQKDFGKKRKKKNKGASPAKKKKNHLKRRKIRGKEAGQEFNKKKIEKRKKSKEQARENGNKKKKRAEGRSFWAMSRNRFNSGTDWPPAKKDKRSGSGNKDKRAAGGSREDHSSGQSKTNHKKKDNLFRPLSFRPPFLRTLVRHRA